MYMYWRIEIVLNVNSLDFEVVYIINYIYVCNINIYIFFRYV